jgi:hypothetical protein
MVDGQATKREAVVDPYCKPNRPSETMETPAYCLVGRQTEEGEGARAGSRSCLVIDTAYHTASHKAFRMAYRTAYRKALRECETRCMDDPEARVR